MSSFEGERRSLVIRHAVERLGRDEAASFLARPHHALGGQTPIDIAESSDIGLRAVLGILAFLTLGAALDS
ncbi:hypothetical protein ASE00_01570 [Sphingomonas sp. Root710]|uniref:MbcA/ParS/Xre antitoxin family protein n=1 Tax=Sphingomonas sp. Root710 TaxID=1736594 RepID=UPI00070054AC|nr:MbcA/ParS/Xre antitoxin family protein [Sphingomonas sp. Root710]KRB85512.1 hypothetical protein ASE00_01570 [Sphingomonas sp. Root710]